MCKLRRAVRLKSNWLRQIKVGLWFEPLSPHRKNVRICIPIFSPEKIFTKMFLLPKNVNQHWPSKMSITFVWQSLGTQTRLWCWMCYTHSSTCHSVCGQLVVIELSHVQYQWKLNSDTKPRRNVPCCATARLNIAAIRQFSPHSFWTKYDGTWPPDWHRNRAFSIWNYFPTVLQQNLDVEQMKKIVPFVTCEITFGQNVCELMFGINVSTLNFRIKINPVKQPIQCNSVGSWNMPHCEISACHYHLNHGFFVLKDIQHGIGTRMCSAWWNVINIGQIEIGVRGWNLFSHVWLRSCRQVSPWLSYILGFVGLVWCGMKHFNHEVPKIDSGNPIHA